MFPGGIERDQNGLILKIYQLGRLPLAAVVASPVSSVGLVWYRLFSYYFSRRVF